MHVDGAVSSPARERVTGCAPIRPHKDNAVRMRRLIAPKPAAALLAESQPYARGLKEQRQLASAIYRPRARAARIGQLPGAGAPVVGAGPLKHLSRSPRRASFEALQTATSCTKIGLQLADVFRWRQREKA